MIVKLRNFVGRYHLWLALGILAVMMVISLFTLSGDSAIVDEIAHIPAGYSYVKYGDFRLNPEHPPLIKDLAGLPLLALHLQFPKTIPAWTTDPNGQWETGWNFIYHIGNDADQILLYSRLPILLVALLLGWAMYRFCLKHFGAPTALLALLFYALSPNILAHDHYVTTDIGIAAATFIAIWSFVAWLQKPASRKLLLVATLCFAIAQLAKFSAIMLVPFFLGLTAIKIITDKHNRTKQALLRYALGFLIMFGLGGLLVWAFYVPHTINMPAAMQIKLIHASLPGGYDKVYGTFLAHYSTNPVLKPLVQYLLGVLMVINRVQSGNITYFLGDVTNQSFGWYFPVSFVLKTPIPMLILMLVTLGAGVMRYARKTPFKVWAKFKGYATQHFLELVCVLFIIFYSYLSIKGNLNLGIRHLFPMMPFIFVLLAKKTLDFYRSIKQPQHKRYTAIGILVLAAWYGLTAFIAFPSYLPYINGLFGGSANASKYLSDSNVDWGQDLKRLITYVNNNPDIDKIAVDYFGGGDPRYYFCKRRYDPKGNLIKNASGYDCADSKYYEWHVDYGHPTTKYIAVSETYLVSDIFYQKYHPRQYDYQWLRDMKPYKQIGDSIYIYKLR